MRIPVAPQRVNSGLADLAVAVNVAGREGSTGVLYPGPGFPGVIYSEELPGALGSELGCRLEPTVCKTQDSTQDLASH